MASGALFRGADLRRVDPAGRTRLPRFVMRALKRAGRAGPLVLGLHESAPCLSGYDEAYEALLYEDIERRRLRDEERGALPAVHHARIRRAFAAAASAEVAEDGACRLPPMLRRRGRIAGFALFVGVGGSFEIWNPSVALEAEDEVLRGLAAEMLAEAAGEEKEAME